MSKKLRWIVELRREVSTLEFVKQFTEADRFETEEDALEYVELRKKNDAIWNFTDWEYRVRKL